MVYNRAWPFFVFSHDPKPRPFGGVPTPFKSVSANIKNSSFLIYN